MTLAAPFIASTTDGHILLQVGLVLVVVALGVGLRLLIRRYSRRARPADGDGVDDDRHG